MPCYRSEARSEQRARFGTMTDDRTPRTRPADPTLAAVVRQHTGVAWSRARSLCIEGRVTINGERCLDPAMRITAGVVVAVHATAPRLETGPLSRDAIVYRDRDVVVVDKPAGMLSVADE